MRKSDFVGPLFKRNESIDIKKTTVLAAIPGYLGKTADAFRLREVVFACVCAGQSKTGSIVKAFETLLDN